MEVNTVPSVSVFNSSGYWDLVVTKFFPTASIQAEKPCHEMPEPTTDSSILGLSGLVSLQRISE